MPRLQHRSNASGIQLPVLGHAALVRDAIAQRRQNLDEYDEVGAIDAAALLIDRIHEVVVGRIPAVSGDRTPRYRRGQFSGSNGFPIEDFAFVALSDETAAFELLITMCELFGYEPPRLADPDVSSVSDEMGDVIEAFSETAAEWARAMGDGQLSRSESAALRPKVERLLREVVEFKAAMVSNQAEK